MYYFREESKLIKQLLALRHRIVTVVSHLFLISFICLGFYALSGCTQISLQKKVTHNLIKTPTIVSGKSVTAQNRANKPVNLNGIWKIGFRYQGKSDLGSMQIEQSNQNFSGQGRDEKSGSAFRIEKGQINGEEIIFLKRYDSRPNQSVQYHGHFSYLPTENGQLPYMGGDFSFENGNSTVVGEWEAAMAEVKNAPAKTVSEEKAPVEQKAPPISDRAPDLSGKWSVAYEYNFKTVHSTMFLEQDGNKISGHGADATTHDKFVIKKGWYTFPHLTIVREYANKTLTFKAEVSEVADKDYSGPYLSGKTQGGGEWEAEKVY